VLVLGFVALAGAPIMAARSSGRLRWFGAGVLAAAGFLLALVIGAIAFGVLVDNILVGLVVALAVEGAIAIRPPVRSARVARVIVIGVLLALCAAFALENQDGGIGALTFFTLPAIGLADTIAVRSERRVPDAPLVD
jgi:hypothetical protein